MKRKLRKIADYFTAASFIVLVIFAAAWFSRLGEEEYSGSFKVMDGDSLSLGEQRFRLEGIDAPEYQQMCQRGGGDWPCGRESARYLRGLMKHPAVTCRGLGVDKYERVLARCFIGEEDINRSMVANGWAVSFGDYQGAERQARENGKGIWAGEFMRPRDWRDLHASTTQEGSSHGLPQRMIAALRGWVGNWF